ncbi:MAG: rhodanese-like domain-containing protein [Gammaproteobacteria bacterium]|jgi:rhodanese-related sulfurtransferase
MSSVSSMTPSEFRARWPQHGEADDVVLLDVREPHEVAFAAVDSSLHIPMSQVPARISELNADATIVVMCHSGIRSMRVAGFLAQHGFENVVNLDGGIDAWSREVDPGIPGY